jgi:hypothetical protein
MTVIRMKDAQAMYAGLADSAVRFGREKATVGSDLKYAYGIETGRHKSGRLARRAGGSWAVRDSQQSVLAYAPGLIVREIERLGVHGKMRPQTTFALLARRALDSIRNLLIARVYSVPIPRRGRGFAWKRTHNLRMSYRINQGGI